DREVVVKTEANAANVALRPVEGHLGDRVGGGRVGRRSVRSSVQLQRRVDEGPTVQRTLVTLLLGLEELEPERAQIRLQGLDFKVDHDGKFGEIHRRYDGTVCEFQ